MIHVVRIIDTILLAMTALVMCLCSFRVLSQPIPNREESNFVVVFFFTGIVGIIIAIGLLWC